MIMNSYSLEELAEITNGNFLGNKNTIPVRELLIDSRQLTQPDVTLFVALVTDRNDGHRFVSELFEKGVKNFLVSQMPDARSQMPDAGFLLVKDTLTALQAISAHHRSRFKIPVIGITGSNGKTIVKEWLYQLMSREKKIIRNPKSYNSQIGVPLSVWNMEQEYELAIFEAGISMPGEMEKLEAIIRPTIGIFTNIGHAHDENFNDLAGKTEEKLKLFRNVSTLVYCRDYQVIHESLMKTSYLMRVRKFAWSKKEEADLFITGIEKNEHLTAIRAIFDKNEIEIIIPFTDDASIENAIHCWSLMLLSGYDQETIKLRMMGLTPIAMRLELRDAINRCSLINDSYNSDINSLGIAIDFLNQQKQHEKKSVILSDILQSGQDKDELYSEIAGILAGKGINRLIGIGKDISLRAAKFPMEKHFFESTDQFLRQFPVSSFHDESILLKGARIFEFEKISNILQQKIHETVLEVNLDALVHNLNYYRSLLDPGTKTMVMVKALSYGSGSFEIASLLQFHHVDYLAVAFADEGTELRKAGISLPVMVMNPEEEGFSHLLDFNLEPGIYSFRLLHLLGESVSGNNRSLNQPVKIHIKIDTGMHRLGFERKDIPALLDWIAARPFVAVQSVYSHLAASEDPAEDDFTRLQIQEFREICGMMAAGIKKPFLRHILNSAGITRFPEARMDMVRLGIGLYGVGSSTKEQMLLRNVSTLKSSIAQVKHIKAGDTIGYNRKGIAHRDSTIAIIPVGYADGLNRRLGNGLGKVFIRGKTAPFIGNICMDFCMADITDIEKMNPVTEAEEVIIFGDSYPVYKLAADLGTIPYEILTGISGRVKRVYFHE